MNSGEKVLWDAINKIADSSEHDSLIFRAAPREVLVELARKAIVEYRNLTSRRSRAAEVCAHCGGIEGEGEAGRCPLCGGP